MVIYDNEFETMGNRNEIQPRITLKPKLAAIISAHAPHGKTSRHHVLSIRSAGVCREKGQGARGGDSLQLMPIEVTMPNNEKYCN